MPTELRAPGTIIRDEDGDLLVWMFYDMWDRMCWVDPDDCSAWDDLEVDIVEVLYDPNGAQ